MSCCGGKQECCVPPTGAPEGCCGGAKTDVACCGSDTAVRESVKEYYGKTLQNTSDLKTAACHTKPRPMPADIAEAVSLVHEEVASRYYGCGLTIPALLKGLTVLDLGSGSGRDCYVISRLVGPKGFVHGIDMTDEQLEVARRHIDYHTKKFGYEKPNVQFHKGYIEDLSMIESNSVDVIVSNCVVNLSTDKLAVLREAYRVLRKGGEMYFSDMYADRRVAREVVQDPTLYGEGFGGAMYWNDFMRAARTAGFTDPRLVENNPIEAPGKIAELLGGAKFWAATFRLWKLEGLEADCEDYGQAVVYKGTIPGEPVEVKLDAHHTMQAGRVFPVCGNTWRMLHDTRFAEHFEFSGDATKHFGLFAGCGKVIPFTPASASNKPLSGKCC